MTDATPDKTVSIANLNVLLLGVFYFLFDTKIINSTKA